MKLSKAIELFLNFKEKELSRRTIREYGKDLNIFLRFCGDVDVNDIKTPTVMMFRSHMRCGQSLINRRISTLNTFFEYLTDMEIIPRNPVKRSLRIRKVKQKVPDALSEEEIRIVTKIAANRCFRDYIMVKLMLYCGLRVSEVLNLTRDDIININGRTILKVLGKGDKERFIPIPPALSNELDIFLKDLKSNKLFPISYPGVKYIFDRISAESGIKLHPHRLRHTFATMLVDMGVDIRVIQEFLGHTSPSTTSRYAKVRHDVMFRVAEQILT